MLPSRRMATDDYAERLQRERRRRAIVMALVLSTLIIGAVVGMRLFLDETMTPRRPVGQLSLSPAEQTFAVEVPEPGELVMWVEVDLRSRRSEGWTGSPPFGPTVVMTRDGRTERCDTRQVRAFARLTRSGANVSWFGPLDGCRLSTQSGREEIRAHYEPGGDEEFTVEHVTLTVELEN